MNDVGISLGELVTPRTEKAMPPDFPDDPYLGLDDVEAHSMRLLGSKPSASMKSTAKRFYLGDVLYSRLRPYLNKVWLADRTGLCSSEFIVLPENEFIDGAFLKYRLNARDFVSFANSLNAGDRPRVDFDQISPFKLPAFSLQYQKRIVAKIEELFSELEAGEESLRVARRQLGVYRQSLLKQAFEGKLTAKWRSQNGASDSTTRPTWETLPDLKTRRDVPDIVQIPELLEDVSLPKGWVLRSAAHLLKKGVLLDVKDGNHGTNHPKKADFTDTGLPFLTAAEIRGLKIDFEGAYKIDGEPLKRLHVGFSKPRDVILTHKGSVGRVAVNDRDAMLSPQTTYYRCSERILLPEFLCYYFSSPLFVAQLGEVKGQTTRDFVPISKQYFLFSVIAPLPEQQEIVRVLDEQFEGIERNEREIDGALRSSEALRQAILKKAFTGRLVPQDPTDEPAMELLARLRGKAATYPVPEPRELAVAEPPAGPPKRVNRRLASGEKI